MTSLDDGFSAGTFPKDFGYGSRPENESQINANQQLPVNDNNRSKILLMGLRRSGKSSIQKVVFQKMSPNETLFLESTNKIVKHDINNSAFVNFQLWDMPGQVDFRDTTYEPDIFYTPKGSLIFVIDGQDEYSEAITKLEEIILKAFRANPNLLFEVFIHKADGLTEDNKMEAQRDINQRLNDELFDGGYDQIQVAFHITSIYDHSIFEAFSKVIQKLIPQLAIMENMLNILVESCRVAKAFLYDVVSKMYVATDSSPVDMQSYELCCDLIDLNIDLSSIYGRNFNSSGGEASSFDKDSRSLIRLNNGTVLYLHEVGPSLAIACIMREEGFAQCPTCILDYNIACFKKGIRKLLLVKSQEEKEQNE